MIDDAGRPGRGSETPSGHDTGGGAVDDALAPVIPLFGARERAAKPPHDGASGETRLGARRARARWALPGDSTGVIDDAGATVDSPDEIRDRAEALLLRRLRGRSLSLVEAGAVVREVEGADEAIVDEVVAKFVDLGYLNDEAFAEQLAMSAIERRGQGRRAVVQTLRKRGIPREVADAAVAELPDDDAERALEFARSKIRGVSGKDYDASLRRLAGQLARRGYSSPVSLDAARQALAEAGVRRAPFTRPVPSGVRFTPDD
ncbi:MAG: RecX family transcriptional regulator [Microbacterium sp.]|nr:RecX family transcriptional regulator [Microbacterium sp.]